MKRCPRCGGQLLLSPLDLRQYVLGCLQCGHQEAELENKDVKHRRLEVRRAS